MEKLNIAGDILELEDELINDGRIFKLAENRANPNCIDGRDSNQGRPSIPGGKFGALGVVLATVDSLISDLDTENRERIIQIVKNKFNGKLGGHTDTHKESKEEGCECDGCGHVYRLLNEGTTTKYNLSQKSIDLLKSMITETATADAKLPEEEKEIVTLTGEHKERRVIIVNTPDFGLKSHGESGQDFVYNAAYSNELYSDLAKELSIAMNFNYKIIEEKIQEIATLHLMSTSMDLAGGLPIYQINDITATKDGINLDIESAGDMPFPDNEESDKTNKDVNKTLESSK